MTNEPDLIEQNKNRPEFLDDVINRFLSGQKISKEHGEYPVFRAIDFLPDRPSEHFEGLYQRLANLRNEPAYTRVMRGFNDPNDPEYTKYDPRQDPHAEFRVRTFSHSLAKDAAVGRITDQGFLKRLVDEVPADCDIGFNSFYASAVSNITDQEYLGRIVATKTDQYIVAKAIGNLTDIEVLQRYANMTDRECSPDVKVGNSYVYPHGALTQGQYSAFVKSHYRDTARERLQELASNALNNVKQHGVASALVDKMHLSQGVLRGFFNHGDIAQAHSAYKTELASQ